MPDEIFSLIVSESVWLNDVLEDSQRNLVDRGDRMTSKSPAIVLKLRESEQETVCKL